MTKQQKDQRLLELILKRQQLKEPSYHDAQAALKKDDIEGVEKWVTGMKALKAGRVALTAEYGKAAMARADDLMRRLQVFGHQLFSEFSGRYSGTSDYSALFDSCTTASFTTSAGARYSHRHIGRKTNVFFHLYMTPADLAFAEANKDRFREWGTMRIIGTADPEPEDKIIPNCMRARWIVRYGRGGWTMRKLYVAWEGGTSYHAETQAGALRGLKRKIAANAKAPSADLADAQVISLRAIRKLTGWCQAGCESWVAAYMPEYSGQTKAPRAALVDAISRAESRGPTEYTTKLRKLLGHVLIQTPIAA